MVIEIKPETELLLQQELSNGTFRSVEEVILRGLNAGPEASPLPIRRPLPDPEQRAAAFRKFYMSLPRRGFALADKDMERSSFYGDRG